MNIFPIGTRAQAKKVATTEFAAAEKKSENGKFLIKTIKFLIRRKSYHYKIYPSSFSNMMSGHHLNVFTSHALAIFLKLFFQTFWKKVLICSL